MADRIFRPFFQFVRDGEGENNFARQAFVLWRYSNRISRMWWLSKIAVLIIHPDAVGIAD
ncbi:MAG: hypothetical protein IPL27_26175 [Lewinellaceae bacterium]|nr:hypothetical protein [Lewinellaceae bacterium]